MLAEFIRKDSGRIDSFLTRELGGVLHKEGTRWVPNKVNSQGLTFNPAFLAAINQLSQISDILFTDGSQGYALSCWPVRCRMWWKRIWRLTDRNCIISTRWRAGRVSAGRGDL